MKHFSLEKICQYKDLIGRFKNSLDLMSESAYENIDRHLSDAKAFVDSIQGLVPLPRRILDLGSGVGLPGVVISIVLPDTTVRLVERRRRRGAFLEIVRSQLDLNNTEVFLGDVRQLGGETYEVVTALAFGALGKIYDSTVHLHAEQVTIISRKSADWAIEVGQLEDRLGVKATMTKEMPLGAHGRLITVQLPGGIEYQ